MEEKNDVKMLSTEEALKTFEKDATLETFSAEKLTTEEAKEVYK